MNRRALLVGIDAYDFFPSLRSAAADAHAMGGLLCRHENGEPNYHCRVVTDVGGDDAPVTRARLVGLLDQLFDEPDGDVLFFFAGHGTTTRTGGTICTSDATSASPGLAMSEILIRANRSTAREVLILLDCCYSGALGESPYQDGGMEHLREGVTLLAASRATQRAAERLGHGVFTGLLLDGLRGGAADIRGSVTAADLHAYAAQILDAWEQRPLVKSYTSGFSAVRRCAPLVSDQTLREILNLFEHEDSHLQLDTSYEETSEHAAPANVAKFFQLKELRNAGLVQPVDHPDLYWAAMGAGRTALTTRGKRYWRMAKKQLL